ncbi:MAG: hypothetical protein IJW99_04070 [Clostridia bacterium]|nr:hypothetical protein [Clostridia bacterium]
MTETTVNKGSTVSQLRAIKRRAWQCFFSGENSLVLIAATLIPIVMYVAMQGIYSMIYFALEPEEMGGLVADIASVVDYLLIFLILPLFGGTLYIVTGLARGEKRALRDVFYAYTTWRAHGRTWLALLIPIGAVAIVVMTVLSVIAMSQGIADTFWSIEEGKAYSYLFLDGGNLFAALIGLLGAILCAFVMPVLWLLFAYPARPVRRILADSATAIRRHLGLWFLLHISFLGWLLLSVATVGILLVLFVLPYYLLTVSFYLSQTVPPYFD